MTHQQTKPLRRAGTVLSALAALTLTACADGEVAEFEDADQPTADVAQQSADPVAATSEDVAQETGTEPQVAEAGLIHDEMSQTPAVVETIRPQNDVVITPAGTLTIESVESAETVPSEEIGLKTEQGEVARPADGEVFRILTMSFEPDPATQGHGDDTLDVDAALALNVGGVQQHLHDLTTQQDFRILVSVPQAGESALTISSEGHDQSVDVLTGERAEDEVAAGYYREVTLQDLNHTFPVDSQHLVLQHELLEDHQGEAEVSFDLRVNSVVLSAWTPADGWAAPGEAWLVVDWGHSILAENDVYESADVNDVALTLTAEVGTEKLQYDYKDMGGRRVNESTTLTHLAVPIDTVDVRLSVAGTVVYEHGGGNHVLAEGESGDLEFASDTVEVSFPDTRFGSDAEDVEDAEDDQATQTGEPGQDQEEQTGQPGESQD